MLMKGMGKKLDKIYLSAIGPFINREFYNSYFKNKSRSLHVDSF